MLCTQAELELHMHADFGTDPEDAVTQLIESASAVIESAAGRSLTQDTVTGELHNGGETSIWLRRPPCTNVANVTEDGNALTVDVDYLVTTGGRLVRLAGAPTAPTRWAMGIRNVSVDYTGGPATVPNLARSICLDVVARAFKAAAAWANSPDVGAFVKRLKLDTDEAEFRPEVLDVANTAVKLTDDEKAQLQGLRAGWFE